MTRSEDEPVDSSSGEEEDVSSEGSESESDPGKTLTPPPSSKKTQLTPNSSSDESDSDSDSDADRTPEKPPAPEPSIKPLASKPMDDNQSKKPRSKNPTSRYSPPPLKSPAGKRLAPENEIVDSKRPKKKTVVAVAAPDADNGGEKKQLFQRLWSENDEIELIQGMINYVEKKGKDPIADLNDFHEFVKKSLHLDVNNRQMATKVRRLKKKFANNFDKVEKKGKVRSLSNPHEKRMYELSKKLWGNGISNSNKKVKVTLKTNPAGKNIKAAASAGSGGSGGSGGVNGGSIEAKPNVVRLKPSSHGFDQPGSITEEQIMNKGLELLSGSKKVELEEKWKSLKVQELKHFLKKLEVMKEQTEIIMNVLTKSGAD